MKNKNELEVQTEPPFMWREQMNGNCRCNCLKCRFKMLKKKKVHNM